MLSFKVSILAPLKDRSLSIFRQKYRLIKLAANFRNFLSDYLHLIKCHFWH